MNIVGALLEVQVQRVRKDKFSGTCEAHEPHASPGLCHQDANSIVSVNLHRIEKTLVPTGGSAPLYKDACPCAHSPKPSHGLILQDYRDKACYELQSQQATIAMS